MNHNYRSGLAEQIGEFQNWPLEKLLHYALNSQSRNNTLFALCLAKARKQSFNSQSLTFALQLFDRQGSKWLGLIQRFAETDLKLVFSFCIKNIKTYPGFIQALHIQGDHQRQAIFQTNIENALDGQMTNNNITLSELSEIYIEYLKIWFLHLPHRTIYALEKIENRLCKTNNIYLSNFTQNDLVRFVDELARILRFHELDFMRRFELRKFWNSIPATITFLKDLLSSEGMGLIEKLILTLQSRSVEGFEGSFEQRKWQQKKKQDIVLFLTYTSQVSILQEIYLHTAERLAKQLVHTYVIDYWNFKDEDVEDLILLENSLIYQVQSDDLPSLIQQLLSSLAKHIPSFLTHFLFQCSVHLLNQYLDEISISDIVLKLCILSKQVIHHYNSNQKSIKINQIISRLASLSQSRSELTQIQTLKLMHYFNDILPDNNFISYHEIIFRVIRKYLSNEIDKIGQYNQNKIRQYNQTKIRQQRETTMYQVMLPGNSQIKQLICTKIFYNECIKILEQETETVEETKKTELRIRKSKFANTRKVSDLVREHENWISERFLELICIEGYCVQQSDVFKLYRSFIEKYPNVAERGACSILKVLAREFMAEFERLRSLKLRQKDYQKLFEIVNCIILVVKRINQDVYVDCQTLLQPVLSLLKESYQIQVEKQLLNVLEILIDKAGIITPDLSRLIVYAQETLKKSNSGMSELQGIVQKLCKPSVVNSVTQDWHQLVLMLTKLFREYIIYMVEDKRFEMYEKQWTESLNLAQLFFQTYQDEFQTNKQLSQVILQIQFYVEKTLPSEVGFQLVMTIHHIDSNSQIYSFYDQQLINIDIYQQRYSLNLAVVALVDITEKNFKNNIFQYNEHRNWDDKINSFINQFAQFRKKVQEVYYLKLSTPNDLLPFGKINIERYIQSCLEYLYKNKLIDTVQFIDLKNKLLDHSFLVRSSLFE